MAERPAFPPGTQRRAHPLVFWRWKLHWQILLGLLLGAALGGVSAWTGLSAAAAAGTPRAAEQIVIARADFLLYDLIGSLFMRGLMLIIVPLVVSSIVLAVVNIGSGRGFGRLTGKTLLYYLSTSLIAILIGLTLVDIVRPGIGADGRGILQDRDVSAFQSEQQEIEGVTAGKSAVDFLGIFRAMVPPNVFAAAADNGQLLGLIVVALLVGYFLARQTGEPVRVLISFTEGVYALTMRVTDLVLRLAPLGVAMLIAATVARYAARLIPDARFEDFLTGILTFALTAFTALLLHFVLTMSLILLLVARVNPWRHYRAMAPALLTAFSTASSSATLPVTIECVEKRAGVPNRVAGFVLPLGATVNMDGTALYECVAAIFICQAFGVELSFAQQFFIVIVALLTSIGVAGVPSASIVAIVVILESISAQLEARDLAVPLVAGLGLIWVFDRPLDMCRTAVNIFSDSCGAAVIGATEARAAPAPAAAPEPTGTAV